MSETFECQCCGTKLKRKCEEPDRVVWFNVSETGNIGCCESCSKIICRYKELEDKLKEAVVE